MTPIKRRVRVNRLLEEAALLLGGADLMWQLSYWGETLGDDTWQPDIHGSIRHAIYDDWTCRAWDMFWHAHDLDPDWQ